MVTTLKQAKNHFLSKAGLAGSAVIGATLSLISLPHFLGFLVSQFGLSWQDALAIIGMLTGWGSAILSAMEPWLIPFIGTLWGLIIFVGVSAAAGW